MQAALPHPSGSGNILAGVLCGIAAGALWGLVFLAPELARAFSPLQLSIGRYLAYGLLSVALIAPRWARLRALLSRRDWLDLAWLALAGNTLYYILLAAAVQTGGIAMTSLIVGFLPVLITLIGSRARGAVPFAQLLPSLLFCAAGAICIGWHALAALASGAQPGQLVGLACAVAALLCWTAFAIGNSRALARLGGVSAHEWNLLLGLATGAQALLLLPAALIHDTWTQSGADWLLFAALSVGVALLASLGGYALWNRMSRLLPLTLVGQMILFETLFALIYAFLWEQRLPTALEAAAFVFLSLGVVTCLSAHQQRPR
ncbi:MAG: multidrug DMT transporter permease [Sphingomonas sp. SCN 67-18]|uniref:DMT family transporter n=1 Tax=uncultured Sphingomonas sp. TaxID=158754 RepID=UPI00086F269C|nr:DMT family transporter [Sphingomonas sp. SCN 67-18]ODU22673.1 MAG: multidrug DMT transporter permease [Sphingomonas sp. SCN 67-18]